MRLLRDLTSVSIGAYSCLLKLFHMAGFVNFALHIDQNVGIEIGEHHWRVNFIWWMLHCLYWVISCVMSRFDYNCLYNGLEVTDAMNNYFRYVIGMATAFASLGDSCCSAGTHRSIWKCYQRLAVRTAAYVGLLDRDSEAAYMRRILKFFIVTLATCAVVQYKAFYTLRPGTQWQCFWMYNIYPITMSYLRHMFHLLHIGLMTENVRQLRTKLNQLRQTVDEPSEVENITLNPRKHEETVLATLERLEDCRSIYTELWLANEGINELFGFSQAFNVACSFLQIAFDMYWMRAMWLSGEPNLDLQLFLFVPTPLILWFLMFTINDYHLAVESVKQSVLDMPCMHDERLMQLRGYFLGQLRRFRLRLTARNIFEFDKTLIPKLAFVVVTYLVIFIEIN
ncbi:AGAP009858-PA-like protein [Anopheles sinensis]|uniref:Gustatory receptor n=1 Tax=Anopheles sinensis TaxID=74873 RepID=A0A084W8Y1_ANOSI|nr:AGAP009858-PA-like protein [Anopheles sinensis]